MPHGKHRVITQITTIGYSQAHHPSFLKAKTLGYVKDVQCAYTLHNEDQMSAMVLIQKWLTFLHL